MTAVGSFAVGEVLTAASLNEIGAWTTYTPTYGGLTKGNATIWDAKYYLMNKIGFVDINLVLGSTSAVTGDVSITLPSGWTAAHEAAGSALVTSAGTVYICYWRVNAAGSGLLVRAQNAAGTYLQSTNISATIPATWTTGDYIKFTAVIPVS